MHRHKATSTKDRVKAAWAKGQRKNEVAAQTGCVHVSWLTPKVLNYFIDRETDPTKLEIFRGAMLGHSRALQLAAAELTPWFHENFGGDPSHVFLRSKIKVSA